MIRFVAEQKVTGTDWAPMAARSGVAFLICVVCLTNCRRQPSPITIEGVVLVGDKDIRKQTPIGGARVTLQTAAGAQSAATSDNTGFFRIGAPASSEHENVTLRFAKQDYDPSNLSTDSQIGVVVARLTPRLAAPEGMHAKGPEIAVSNLRLRYTIKQQATGNIASIGKTFIVSNKGGVPCKSHPPCSPDGKWKAADERLDLDAGEGNVFRDLRASCIAGPCVFTSIKTPGLSSVSRHASVSAMNWSDSAVFLVEAEIDHTSLQDVVRIIYPVIVGQAMDFTLPADAEGATVIASVDGTEIVFPLGPKLILSWANCTSKSARSESALYRCELKPEYVFK